jgi:hypothetical protein
MSAMAHEHNQIWKIVKDYLTCHPVQAPKVALQLQDYRQIGGSTMTCPSCRSGNEMLFSPLSMSFICEEVPCGFELEVDPQTAEVLLQPELDLALA